MREAISNYRVKEINSLRLEGKETSIYLKGNKFRQCVRLVLQIAKNNLRKYDEIDSIDIFGRGAWEATEQSKVREACFIEKILNVPKQINFQGNFLIKYVFFEQN